MRLITLKKMCYGGKSYAAGERFEAADDHASLLILVKAAKEAPKDGYARADLRAEPAAGAERGEQQYARRDLQAGELTSPASRANLTDVRCKTVDAPVKRKRGRPRKVCQSADA